MMAHRGLYSLLGGEWRVRRVLDYDGFKYPSYGLYETAGTLNSSWGYKYYDQNWITAEEIVD